MVITKNRLKVELDPPFIWKDLGYEDRPPSSITSLLEEQLETLQELIQPRYACITRDVYLVHEEHCFLQGMIVLNSHVVARLLQKCCSVAMFAVTIGPELEERVSALSSEGMVLKAHILDVLGSRAVEQVADQVYEMTKRAVMMEGLCMSRRISPGYCDWDMTQQKFVFNAVDGQQLGITLNDECFMYPAKSLSGIMGIGPSRKYVENYNPCPECDRQNCPGRRLS